MSSLNNNKREVRAQSVQISDDTLTLEIVDRRTISVPLMWYPRLWYGTPQERDHYEIFGDGAYVHWPDLDEDSDC